jgi:aspartate aminotransferase
MDPNDEIIIPEPFYANYNGFSVANGVKIVPIFSSIDDNFSLPNIEEFENLITDKTKAILICNPNNPTGYVYSKEELKILIKIVKKHNLFLIVDEVYREFTYDGTSHTSVMEFDEISENAIVIDSVSKRYSMCGARIGCIISKNKEFLNTAMKFAQARLSPPSLAQIASTAALDTGKDYFEKIIEEYNKRRVVLIKGLKDIPGVKVSEPKGAFYCVAELPVDDSEDFAKWLLESYNLNKKTIMIAPAGGFYSTPNAGNNQVRIAYVLNENDLKDSIEILKIGLIEYSK